MYNNDKSYCGPRWLTLPRCLIDDYLNFSCYLHDEEYSEMIRRGLNPYFKFNCADELLLERLKTCKRSFARWIVKTVFLIKKFIF